MAEAAVDEVRDLHARPRVGRTRRHAPAPPASPHVSLSHSLSLPTLQLRQRLSCEPTPGQECCTCQHMPSIPSCPLPAPPFTTRPHPFASPAPTSCAIQSQSPIPRDGCSLAIKASGPPSPPGFASFTRDAPPADTGREDNEEPRRNQDTWTFRHSTPQSTHIRTNQHPSTQGYAQGSLRCSKLKGGAGRNDN